MSKKINFDQIIDRQQTDSLKWDMRKFKKMDLDVIPMWVADMDFKCDSAIIEALEKSVRHGIFGYTLENPAYKESLISWLKRRHQTIVEPQHIMTTLGVVSGLSVALQATTQPLDKVLIFTPVYHPFKSVIEKLNRKLVIEPLQCDESLVYTINFERLNKTIINQQVKAIIFCTPHNPIGRVWTKEELIELANIAQANNVWILSDDIHMDIVFSPFKHHMLIGLDESYRQFVITFVSATKTFNLANMGLSQVIVFNQDVKSQMEAIYERDGIHIYNYLGQVATTAAYQHGDQFVDQLVVYLNDNIKTVKDYFDLHLPMIKATPQQGLYLMWLDCKGLSLTQTQLMDFFIKEVKVWVHSGEIFGQEGIGFIRVNIATPRKNIIEMLDRLKHAVKRLV